MMAVMREEERLASTRALLRLLERLAQGNPEETDGSLAHCLQSQGALASFSSQSEGISACSLNTLKRSCVEVPGGFRALDEARKRLLTALRSNRLPIALEGNSKRRIEQRNMVLKQRLEAATADLMLLTYVFEKALHQSRQYATDSRDASVVERCRKEQAELRDMLSLRRIAGGPVLVASTGA